MRVTRLGLIGCGEWDVLTERLKLLLAQAEQKGLMVTNAYVAAKAYYEDNVGWWKTAVLVGDACTEHVREVNDHINALTSALNSAGIEPVVTGHEVEAPEATNYASLLKWVIGGVFAVAGAVTVAKLAPLFLGRKRRLAGYGRRRK